MSQIKDTNVIKTAPVVLNPVFFLPPDVIDVRVGIDEQTNEDDPVAVDIVVDSDDIIDVDETAPDTSFPEDENTDDDTPEGLPTPEVLTIISQTVRIAPDGKAVVDVVIEITDVAGPTEYDIRVTK